MKNMSFGKMMGLFGGFLLLMIVCAFVIIKFTAGGASQGPQVTTKRYNPPAQPAVAPSQSGQTSVAAVVPAGSAIAVPAGSTATMVNGPAVAGHALSTTGAHQVVIPATPGAINDVNQNHNIANVSAAVINLDARVAALEAGRARIDTTTKGPHPLPLRRVRKSKPAVKVVVVREVTPLTQMRGYKAMAVVGGRAWVSAPDGSEESVLVGEAIPHTRVRAVSKDTGMVITTNDQRIDPIR